MVALALSIIGCVALVVAVVEGSRSGWHRMSCWTQEQGGTTVVVAGGAWGVPFTVDGTEPPRPAHPAEPPEPATAAPGSGRRLPVDGATDLEAAAEELAMLERLWLLPHD